MRWIVNYIRSCFCTHDWELLDESTVYDNTDYCGRMVKPYIVGTRWVYRCKKCGASKQYQNF